MPFQNAGAWAVSVLGEPGIKVLGELELLFTRFYLLCACMCDHTEVRAQLVGICSLLPFYGSWELTSGSQAWRLALLSPKPSRWPSRSYFCCL